MPPRAACADQEAEGAALRVCPPDRLASWASWAVDRHRAHPP
jgi:hypothetical protein